MRNILKTISISAALAASLATPHVDASGGSYRCGGGSTGGGTPTPSGSDICQNDITWDFTTGNGYASDVTGEGHYETETYINRWGRTKTRQVWVQTAAGDYTYSSIENPPNDTMDVTISGWNESTPGGTLANADDKLYHWGSNGIGIYEASSPEHGVDNDGADEFILFDFGEPVSLVCYTFGWPDLNGGYDYDSTLAYWDGGASADPQDILIGDLDNNGWKLAGNYVNEAGPNEFGDYERTSDDNHILLDSSVDTQAGEGMYSRYWIIGAQMSQFASGITGDGAFDYFKLSSVSVVKKPDTPPPPGGEVPSPAPLALMAAGLFLLRKRLV